MNIISKINLKFKIVIPTIALITMPLIVLLILSQHFLQKRIENELDKNMAQKQLIYENNLKLLLDKNLQISSLAASMTEVQNVFEKFNNDSSNFNWAFLELGKSYKNIEKTLNHSIDYRLKLQYFYLPFKPLYRSWTQDLDDINISLRKSVNMISQNSKHIKTIELGRDGLKIRGLTPILAKDSSNKLFGVVESNESYVNLLERTKLDKNEEYAIYLTNNVLKSINKKNLLIDLSDFGEINELKSLIDTTIKIGEYTLAYKSSDLFYKERLENEDINQTSSISKPVFYTLKDSIQYIFIRIKDIQETEIGFAVFQQNIDLNYKYISQIKYSIKIIVVFTILLGFLLLFIISIWIVNQLQVIVNTMKKIGNGELVNELETKNDDEIGYIRRHLNEMIRLYSRYVVFVKEISDGNLDADFQVSGVNDRIGHSLLDLRLNLSKAKQAEEIRMLNDSKIVWANDGQALFVEILRQNAENFNEQGDRVIKAFVDYMGANQGGIFIINNSDKQEDTLDLMSCYAYNQKRFLEKRIKIGVGLVGMCALEKITYYKTDVPENYTTIRSGLGFSTPKSLLIIPLKTENFIFGVIEIASLRFYNEFEIKFAERIADNICASFYATKMNVRTNDLLEQSRRQAEELAAQEIEMRYSMEILEQTQQETNHLIQETAEKVRIFNQAFLYAEFDLKGVLLNANIQFGQTLKILNSEAEGKHISMFFDEEEYEKVASFYKKVLKGISLIDIELKILSKASHIWLKISFLPFKDKNNEIEKIIFLGSDINQLNSKVKAYENELNIIDKSLFIVQFDLNGKIINLNKNTQNILKTTDYEVVNKKELFKLEELQTSLSIWEILLDGEIYYEKLELLNAENEIVRFNGLFYPVFRTNEHLDKIIFYASNFIVLKNTEN